MEDDECQSMTIEPCVSKAKLVCENGVNRKSNLQNLIKRIGRPRR